MDRLQPSFRRFTITILILTIMLVALPAPAPKAAVRQPVRAAARPIISAATQRIKEPQPLADQLLSLDDGVADDSVGGNGNPGFGWFNLLKPDNYPATLKEVQIAFSSSSRGVPVGSPFKVQIYLDADEDGPNNGEKPVVSFSVTANNPGSFERYSLNEPITINSGAFVIGVLDPIFVAELPAFIDLPGKFAPAGSRSYVTLDNAQTFLRVDQTFPGFGLAPGSWMIRGVADVADLPPIITRAFYRKSKLRIIGRNFADNAIIRINGQKVDNAVKFDSVNSKFIIKGSAADLNLNPAGQSNRLVVVVNGVASAAFEFTT